MRGHPATNVFDGNVGTIWHTEWVAELPLPPHEIQIDLGDSYAIDGFRYLPRQDGSENGWIGQYEFYVSADGSDWGVPVAAGVFSADALEKEVVFEPKTGRFISLVALTEVNGGPWTSMAGINVLGSLPDGYAPNGVLDVPSGNVTINEGEWVEFAGTGSDPDGDYPLSFLWHFGAGSGVSDLTEESPGQVQFNNSGTYTVTFMVTDARGVSDPTPATCKVNVLSAFPEEVVPDWTTVESNPFNLIEPTDVTNPVLTNSDVTDVDASFVADPFVFHENGSWYMFFEVMKPVHADIGLATSSDGLHWTYEQIVLSDGIHHSYPLVMKYEGRYFMIPESYQAQEVRIYEATNFPYGWTQVSTILSGRSFVDPSVFRYNNKWWMFVSDSNNNGDCYLYYSDDLLGGWVEHPMSPIVNNDVSKARPGGRSFVFDHGRIIRVAQKNDIIYGQGVRAFEVDILDETQYAEHEIPESPILYRSGNGWNEDGMHQFDPWWTGNYWLCAVDGRNGGTWSIGIYITEN